MRRRRHGRYAIGTVCRRGTLAGLTRTKKETQMKVGFIGVGMMGAGMASNMQKGGNEVVVNDLTRQAASRHLNAGATWADTPNAVDVVRSLHAQFAEKGVHFLDAPVSGGPSGANSGKLAIWVGGDKAIFD